LLNKGEEIDMNKLVKTINDFKDKDWWWNYKTPPLLVNWLSKKQWLDQPHSQTKRYA
jgi:hypothetical protein